MTRFAIVFPGQGSQFQGMLSDLADAFSTFLDTFREVSDAVSYDVWKLVQHDPDSRLNQTEYTQVAMLTADVAVYRLLEQTGIRKAAFMAGHSLGEYAALVCAGALSLKEAAILVEKRGQLMQQTIPLGVGAMAALVGLSDDVVSDICHEASDADGQVTPANFNAPGQVVIAGHTVAIQRAVCLAEAQEARMAKILPVSVPCHCPLLKEAAEAFRVPLQETQFKVPEIPVISNVDLSIYQTPEQIRLLLNAQLFSPVRWVETIQLMKSRQTEKIVECGPGKVLSGLVKRIDRSLSAISVNDSASLEQAVPFLR